MTRFFSYYFFLTSPISDLKLKSAVNVASRTPHECALAPLYIDRIDLGSQATLTRRLDNTVLGPVEHRPLSNTRPSLQKAVIHRCCESDEECGPATNPAYD